MAAGPDAEVQTRSRLSEVSDGRGVGASRGVQLRVQEGLNEELQWGNIYSMNFVSTTMFKLIKQPDVLCELGSSFAHLTDLWIKTNNFHWSRWNIEQDDEHFQYGQNIGWVFFVYYFFFSMIFASNYAPGKKTQAFSVLCFDLLRTFFVLLQTSLDFFMPLFIPWTSSLEVAVDQRRTSNFYPTSVFLLKERKKDRETAHVFFTLHLAPYERWKCLLTMSWNGGRRTFRERKEHRRGFFCCSFFLFRSSFIKRPTVGLGMSEEARASCLCRFSCDVNNLPVLVFLSFVSLLLSFVMCLLYAALTLLQRESVASPSQPSPQCRTSSYTSVFKKYVKYRHK